MLQIPNLALNQKLHKTIKAVTKDIERFSFNTAIARIMELINAAQDKEIDKDFAQKLLLLLSPFAPHIAQELWAQIGNEGRIMNEPWPAYDPELVKDETIEIPIQINGKLRDKIIVSAQALEEEVKNTALSTEKVKTFIANKEIIKIIFANKKLINIVIR